MEIACSKSATVRTQPYSGKNINTFEKPVAQLSVRMPSATVRTPPKEFIPDLVLDLCSL
jgi:hypothetical protein